MKTKKTITLCASASYYKEVLEVEKQLEKMGLKVKVPKTAKIMQKTKNFNVGFYKTWFKDKKDYVKKRKLMEEHFRKIVNSDAILVLNLKKNGIKGYIGGNVFMEMALAFHFGKLIFIYSDIDENLSIKEEVYGLDPLFIKQDLQLVVNNFDKQKTYR